MFTTKYSEKGTGQKVLEVVLYFAAEGRMCCSLEEVNFSEADHPPSLEFPCTPQLHYLPEDALFFTSSPCSLILCLPT